MRKFIDIIESGLIEMPVSNVTYGANFDSGTGFSDIDKKLVSSPKYKDRIVKAFARTPHDFEIHFMNSSEFNGNEEGDNDEADIIESTLGGFFSKKFKTINCVSGKITIVVLGNLSPVVFSVKIPITPWIIGHKIGHGIQNMVNLGHNTTTNLENKVYYVDEIIKNIGKELGGPPSTKREKPLFGYSQFTAISSAMTSRSASTLDSEYEIFPEIISQYLISGRATMTGVSEKLMKELNKAIKEMFAEMTGHILVVL